uniref:Outer membrane adhesin like protein n=1 Tax=Caulobacter sp. (strain K31) TaxID=366602 RepID=B0SXS4_CAUSK
MNAPHKPAGRMDLTGEVIAGYQRDHTIPKELFLGSDSEFIREFLKLGDDSKQIFDFDSKSDNIQMQHDGSIVDDGTPHNGSHPAKTQAISDILKNKYNNDYRYILEHPDTTPEQKNQIRRDMGEFLKKTANEVQFKSSGWVDPDRQLINSATKFDPVTKKNVPVSKLVASPEWQNATAAEQKQPARIAEKYNDRILKQPFSVTEARDFKILSDLGGGRTIALTPGDPDAVKNLRAIDAEAKRLGVPDDANFYDKIKAVDKSLGVDTLVEQTHALTDQIHAASPAERGPLVAQRDELIRQTEAKINARAIGADGAKVEARKAFGTLRNVVGDLAERGLLRKAGRWAAGEGAEFLVKHILPKFIPGLNVVSTALDIYDTAMFAYEIYKRRDEIAAFARRIGAEFASVAHAEDKEGGAVEVTTIKLPNEVDEIVVVARRAPGTNVFQVLGAYAKGTFRQVASALEQATGMSFRLKSGELQAVSYGFASVSLAPNGGSSTTTTSTYDHGRVTHSQQVVQSAESMLGDVRSMLDSDYEVRQGLYFNLNTEETYGEDGALEETRTDVDAVRYKTNANGRLVAETQRSRFTAAQFGSILGSNISNLLGIDNPWLKLSAGTVLGTIGLNLGDALDHGGTREAFSDAFNDLDIDLLDAGIGAVSSYLFGELVAELGMDAIPTQVITTVGGAAISTIAVNLAHSHVWNDGMSANALNAAGAFVGTWLASQLVSFDSTGGQLGSTFGSAIGAAFVVAQFVVAATATSSTTLFGAQLGAFAGPLGAAIGAFAGFIIGGLIGSLFGGKPKAGADLGWNAAEGRYAVTSAWAKNGGSKDGMAAMAMSVAGTLNTVIAASGSTIIDPTSVRLGSYSSKGKAFRYSSVGTSGISYTTPDAEALIAHGSSIALGDLISRLTGGDVLTKRAVLATLAGAGGFDAATLYGNLATAKGYGEYLANRDLITPLMESDPESVFAAGWTITVAQALVLGLDRRASTDWIGGWTSFFDETLGGTIDGLAYAPSVLRFQLSDKNERTFIFIDENGDLTGALGDTIDTAGKLKVNGSASADIIEVSGRALTSTGGLTIGPGSATIALDVSVAALIDAGDGDDIVRAGDLGNDVLGGAGNDKIVGGKLDDWLFGDDGDDTLFAGDVVSAGVVSQAALQAGGTLVVDAVAATAVDGGNGDLLDGGEGNDRLYGGKGSDWLKGGEGVDLLVGGAGGDILEGGAGDDQGASGAAAVLGGAGSDQYVFGYGDGNDVLFDESDPAGVAGSTGDSLNIRVSQLNAGTLAKNWAGGGSYEVDGSVKGGEDAIVFGVGVTMQNLIMKRSGTTGAPGSDLIIQLTAEDPIGVLVNGHVRQIATGDSLTIKDWFESTRKIEWLRFANGDDIRIGDITSYIVGVAGASVILGTNGADWIVGTDGADKIYGLNGDDFGFGGLGNDMVSGDGNNDLVSGGAGDDVVIGGAGNDTVLGDGGDDRAFGGLGADILAGGRGDDVVIAGAGDDVIRYARGDGQDVLIDDLVNNWDLVWQNGAYVNGYALNADGTVSKGGVVYFDGSKWLDGFNYDYDDAAKTLKRHMGAVGGVISANAGIDTLEFAVGVDIQDLMLRRVGTDLEVVVSEVDATGGFSGAADKVTIKDWWSATTGAETRPIEKFSFAATGTLALGGYAIIGGATDGADTLTAAATASWITGGGGDDLINGGTGADILVGGDGFDTLSGGAAGDILYGGAGDDILDGGAGADQLFGGTGTNDIASYASAGPVRAYLDASFANNGNAGGDVYTGIEGLEGSSSSDRLGGNFGANVLRGGGANDKLWGGAGDDTYEFNRGDGLDSVYDGVLVVEQILDTAGTLSSTFTASWQLMRYGTATGVSGDYYQYQLTVKRTADNEVVYQSRDGVDFLYTTPQAAVPGGSAWPYANGQWITGATRINGVMTVLEHIVAGDGGADTLQMGSTISFSDLTILRGSNFLKVSLDGANYVALYDQTMTDRAVETLQLADGQTADLTHLRLAGETASVAADFVIGGAGNDTLSGLAGDDVMSGGAGNDSLDGGAGNDVLEGGAGADTLNGGADSQTDGLAVSASDPGSYGDTIRYVTSGAGVVIDLATRAASGGDAQGDIIVLGANGFGSIENVLGSDAYGDQLSGDNRANRLSGLGGNDVLDGRAGDDVVVGGAGDDTLYGGDGDDALSGEDGIDRLEGGLGKDVLGGGAGGDMLLGQAGDDLLTGDDGDDVLYGGDGLDTLGGDAGADILYGEAGDDKLVGGDGGDQLFGGDGDDVLVGGTGDDLLDGGAGGDIYGFDANSGVDQIVDAAGVNHIQISGVTSDRIWITRDNLDLVIKVIGGDTRITLQNYYAASAGSRVRDIALGSQTLFLDHAAPIITAMSAAGATATDAAIVGLRARYWHAGATAAPVVAAQSYAINEDQPLGGQVGAEDDDDNITAYAVVSGPALGTLSSISATGGWTYTPNANVSGQDHMTLSVTDASGVTVQQDVAIAIAPVNDAPTNLQAPFLLSVPEGTASGYSLGKFTSQDPDGAGEEAHYAFAPNTAHGLFSISDDGELKVALGANGQLDNETAPIQSITLQVTDQHGAASQKTFDIAIADVNERPTIRSLTSAAPVFAETTGTGTLNGATIASFELKDPDNINNPSRPAPSLVLTTERTGWLQANGAQLQFKPGTAIDFDTLSLSGVTMGDVDADGALDIKYSYLVAAKDGRDGALYSSSYWASFYIEDVNEAPNAPVFSNAVASIAERDHPLDGALRPALEVARLASTDPDRSPIFAALSYTVDNPNFEVVFVAAAGAQPSYYALRLKENAWIDFETGGSITVKAAATDMAGAGLSSAPSAITFLVENRDDYLYGDQNALAPNDNLLGGANRDLIYGRSGNDTLNGGSGDDYLEGDDGDDSLIGGDGVDRLLGGNGADILDGGAGADSLVGELGDDILIGGSGADRLSGGDGRDSLSGGAENDVLNGDLGDDTLDGGDGVDQLDGGDGNDLLVGGLGDDSLFGGAGADTMSGGAGADQFTGGADRDTVTYASATSGVIASLTTGGSAGDALGDTFLDAIEVLVGSNYDDSLTGTATNDTLQGGDGNDSLHGGDGDDVLEGGAGDDQLFAESGDDRLYGGIGHDTLVGGTGSDTYYLNGLSGADDIQNFNSSAQDIDIIGYLDGDIDRTKLWFRRSVLADGVTAGNDLIIDVVGTTTTTTIVNWYGPAAANSDNKIDFIFTGQNSSRKINVEQLVTLMAANRPSGVAAGSAPSAAQFAGLLANSSFKTAWQNLWDSNDPPVVAAPALLTIDEATAQTSDISVTISDNPLSGLSLLISAVSATDHHVSDASLVGLLDATDVDANGKATIHFKPKDYLSGEFDIQVIAVDQGKLASAAQYVRVKINPVGTTPQLDPPQPVYGAFANGPIALTIPAALVDKDGSEYLKVELSGVPAALILNKGTSSGGDLAVWTLVRDNQTGRDDFKDLTINGASTWSQDLTIGIKAYGVEYNGHNAEEAGVIASAPKKGELNVYINGAPSSISATTLAVPEGAYSTATLVGSFSASDPDGDDLDFTLVDSAGAAIVGGVFRLSKAVYSAATQKWTTQLILTGVVDHEAITQDVHVKVSDGKLVSAAQQFSVTISDVPEDPTTPAPGVQALSVISENTHPVGAVITYTATDGDLVAPTLEIVDGSDPLGLFVLSPIAGQVAGTVKADLVLRPGAVLDYETILAGHVPTDQDGDQRPDAAYTVQVRSRDAARPGVTSPETVSVTIYVEDVNEAPNGLVETGFAIDENKTSIGTLQVKDEDIGDGVTYSLISDPSGLFAVSGTGDITVAPDKALDFETSPAGNHTYEIKVQARDTGGLTLATPASISITVNEVDEPPTKLIVTTPSTIVEGATAAAIDLATLSSDDPEKHAITYAIVSDPWELLQVSGDKLQLKAGIVDFETLAKKAAGNYWKIDSTGISYAVTVSASDGAHAPVSNKIWLKISDANEAPTIWNQEFSVLESRPGAGGAGVFGTVQFTDLDLAGSYNRDIRFSISGGETDLVSINPLTGELTLQGALDFETAQARQVQVTVKDQAGSGFSRDAMITLNVQNVVEAPTVETEIGVNNGTKWYMAYLEMSASHTAGSGDFLWEIVNTVNRGGGIAPPPLGVWSGSSTNYRQLTIERMYKYGDGEFYEANFDFTLRISDSSGEAGLYTYNVENGGGGRIAPLVLDLGDDGISLVDLAHSPVVFDQDADGVVNHTGWVGPGDGLLVLDRNHNGLIDDGSEISFSTDEEDAVSDLEGLRAYDSNANGFFDSQDDQFSAFKVWLDADSDGVSQTGELRSLAELGITAINLTLTLNPNADPGADENHLYGTTQFVRADGTSGQLGDVMLAYQSAPKVTLISSTSSSSETDLLPPVVIDLDGDGVELVDRAASTVRFDVAGFGQVVRTGWVGADDAFLALDRNGDGKITTGAEISFTGDLEGAVSDLEGLRAFDSNDNGFLDTGDARFGDFRIWQDRNQDGVSQADELHGLSDLGFQALNLTQTLTGASVAVTGANVLYATSDLIRSDGTRLGVGDVMLAFDVAPSVTVTPPAGDLEDVDRTAASTLKPPTAHTGSKGGARSAQPAADPGEDPMLGAQLAQALAPRAWSQIDLAGMLDARLALGALAAVDYGDLAGDGSRSALDAGLALAQQTRLQMIQAMAGFSREGAADFGPDALRRGHAQSLALLTALPDVRVR